MANFGINQLEIIADIFICVVYNNCANFLYQNVSIIGDTTKISKFLPVFEQTFTILPQNNTLLDLFSLVSKLIHVF